MAETPLSAYDIYSAICTATTANVPVAGYCVTTSSDGLSTATTTLLGTSLTGMVDGIALATGVISKPIQVQREGRVDRTLLTWLGAGSIEALVADSNGKPQRASVATGLQIGIVDKQGNAYLDLTLQTATAGAGTTYAAALNGLVWTLPNLASIDTNTCTCPFAAQITARMGGDTNVVYSVSVRIRGVAEVRSYVGGTRTGRLYHAGYRDPANGGGLSAIQNVYRLEVEDPSDYWWLNAWDGSETATNRCFGIDFTTTFSVRGGAWVRLVALSDYEYTTDIPNGSYTASEQKNKDGGGTPITVGGGGVLVTEPYDGQWMQMDVTGVA